MARVQVIDRAMKSEEKCDTGTKRKHQEVLIRWNYPREDG